MFSIFFLFFKNITKLVVMFYKNSFGFNPTFKNRTE